MENENQELADPESVAKQIKKHFYASKKDRNRKPYSPGSKFTRPELWMAAAENCIRAGADPYSFVRGAFMYCSTPGGPFPNNMGSNAAVRWYSEYRRIYGKNEDTQQDIYESEIKYLIGGCMKMALTVQKARKIKISEFLLDDSTREDILPAFVRVLLMPNDERIMKRWGKTAYVELIGNPRLLKLLEAMGHKLDFVRRMRG